ncbi:hypothetical protein TSMEX_003213 [Taenia solium]|eukprot:TsM_000159400 transcript=TsM_000159400 gene=TsM_000159400
MWRSILLYDPAMRCCGSLLLNSAIGVFVNSKCEFSVDAAVTCEDPFYGGES